MMRSLSLASVAFVLLAGAAAAAQPGFGPWSEGERARVRLIAAGIAEDGTLHGGVEIMLEPGWWTYWRTPGAAGIPPTMDFTGSANLGTVDMRFPLPDRHDSDYGASNIYLDGVVFPFTATVPEAGAPVRLSLSLAIGVCEKVCVPETVEAALTVPPGLEARVAGAALAGARAKVPGDPVPGVLAVAGARRSGGTDRHPEFDIVVTSATPPVIFVEGPDDWFPGVPEPVDGAAATYRVTFDRIGAKTPIDGAALRVTLSADGRAIEQVVPVD